VLVALAVKCAYLGSDFAGSQTQPHGRTVEDEIQRALRGIGRGQRVALASRTDAGVSALGNVFLLREKVPLGRLNAEMGGIVCHSSAEVGEDFNPRHADARWYRYVLPDEMLPADGSARFGQALARFRGEHDFSAFCRERTRSARMRVDEVRVDRSCGAHLVDIRAHFFLRNQVRFMIGAAMLAARRLDASWIEESLASGKRLAAVEVAPAQGLILMDVGYDGVVFETGWSPSPGPAAAFLEGMQEGEARAEWTRSLLAFAEPPSRGGKG
jgi:tRNA pseudouridine38-40 synthase